MNPAAAPTASDDADTVPAAERPGVQAANPTPLDLPASRPPLAARNLPLLVLATLACIAFLSWAQSFLVPLMLGIVISYALTPLVAWLQVMRIPRSIGTVIVMVSVIGGMCLGAWSLRGQVQTIIDQVPEAATQFAAGTSHLRLSRAGNLKTIQDAATKVEKATSQAAGADPRQAGTHVIVDAPRFKFSDFLWKSSKGAVSAMGQAAAVAFLVFFLLLGGDTFKRKLVRIAGPSLSRMKIAVHILDDINGSIQKFMFMFLTTNLLVALLSWIAFRWIGLDNAGAWAVVAGLLHVVPYLGPAATAVATGLAAFLQFQSIAMALLVGGASLAIATAVGTLLTTWMTGRIASMNSAAVFISLLFWGWLWGVWGMLLSVPLIVIVKVVSHHVKQLHPLAELLGD
ncbi:MAG: AI-2E family transporter [Steroidobacteraceae bacterium]|nr:AI-2E family transporter [Steroidobacteraceae bacterium]